MKQHFGPSYDWDAHARRVLACIPYSRHEEFKQWVSGQYYAGDEDIREAYEQRPDLLVRFFLSEKRYGHAW